VTLERHVGDTWQSLAQGTTNEQGRIAELYPANTSLQKGEYRVVFKTGDYYKKTGHDTFFPEIPVIFEVKQTDQHYHIPLLLSPYGFSTYRGS
jgi:5-hydroxyisourate hydrolase